MTPASKEKYDKADVRLAKLAKALGHPARIVIFRHLASVKSCCFNEIAKVLPLAGSTVSQHLAELKDAGLIKGVEDPPKVWYSIDGENWKSARRSLKDLSKIKVAKIEKDNRQNL
ncbi:MAG: metalloregulator ArsR/SmtB family transcription factor [Bacteroidales bacterium]